MKTKFLILILCLLCINSTAFSAQVRQRYGYITEQKKYVTTYYLVNSKGQRVSSQDYDYLSEVTSNLFIATNNDKVGLINGYGGGVLPFEYQEIKCLKYGVLKVKQDNKFGLVTYAGNQILPIKYSYLEKVDDRLLKFSSSKSSGTTDLPVATTTNSGGGIGLMDYYGKIVAGEKYTTVSKLNNYLLIVRVGANTGSAKYGLIDYSGRTVLSPQYDYLSKINNTLLRVKKGNNWGRVEYYNGNVINVMFDYESYW